MHRFALAVILSVLCLDAPAARPAAPEAGATQKISVNQLEEILPGYHGKTDAEAAQALSAMQLTERLSTLRLARLKGELPGEKAQQALSILADKAAFLKPPDEEIVADPAPDAAATRLMLVQIVNYVNTTVRQLPNLMAVRETTGFEDRPQEDALEATGIVSKSYLPLHAVGKSSYAVTYRDRKEVVDDSASKSLKHSAPIGGLVTSGEFGPILSTVMADALKGKITWARWEEGAPQRLAVFAYNVPEEKSSYFVKFCCVVNGYKSDGQPDLQVFNERASYRGEITFDPTDGSILRITLEAEMPPSGLVPHAGIAIDYAPVEIGGRNYICPARSVSMLQAHVSVPNGMYSRANYQGPAKTFLNDVEFTQYRRFGSENRIVAGEDPPPGK
jgi:hypothetical protein